MRNSGQRQDVAFLGLAVAVLAIALALFVSMRSIQKPQPSKAEAKAEKKAEVVAPTVQKQVSGPRDPFKGTEGGAAGTVGPGAGKALKLVGIVSKQGRGPVAVLRSTKKRYYAGVGEKAAGYTVVSIGGNQVVLQKDGESVTLLLREPEAQEE